MKKLGAILLFLLCSFVLLCFAITGGMMLFSNRFHVPDTEATFTKILPIMLGSLLPISFCVLGLRYSLQQFIKPKPIETIPYLHPLDISFRGRIQFGDYLRFLYRQAYTKPILIGMHMFGILFLVSAVAQGFPGNTVWMAMVFGFFMVSSPISIYLQAKKLYAEHGILHGEIAYRITQEGISVKGDTQDSFLLWSHFIRAKETKQFILLYQSSNLATLLDKTCMQPQEVSELKTFLLSLPIPKEGWKE